MGNTDPFTYMIIWQKANDFVLETNKIAESYPKEESFGLVSQLKKAAISIPATIAEGHKKTKKIEKLRLLNSSYKNFEKCRYYLVLLEDLKYINNKQHILLANKLEEASEALSNYCKKLYDDIYK